MAELQVPPAGGFGANSLNGNSVIAVQGQPSSGVSTALIGSLTATSSNFTLEFVQRGAGDSTQVTGTARGTYTVGANGRAELTFTSGGFSPTILYLDAVNQGFAGETDTGASTGLIEPGGSNFSNATLSGSGNYFFGSFNPTIIQGRNQVGVGSASATSLQFTSDATGPPGLLLANTQAQQPNAYSVTANGQFTSPDNGVAGYVASACEIEVIVGTATSSGLANVGCQGTPQINETLTVAVNGNGTITSDPAAINCPAACSASFTQDEHIVLTAPASGSSTFTSFSGNCALPNPPTTPPSCTVTMREAQTVTANFTGTSNFTLTVTKAGTGAGTVISAPAGINCGATCSSSFASGTQITLSAAPTAGSTFTGWGAPCQGTGTCVITLTAATTVAATFAPSTNNFTLTVTEAGSGSGTVASSPAGISCQPTCSASFATGQVVALTATAAEGSTFAGWSGAGFSGTGGCSVTVTAATALTATFNSNNSPVTITLAPGTPSAVSTTPGSGAVFGLLLTSIPGTSGNVALGCTSPSPNITCQIVPNSISLNGKGTNVAIVVNTFCTASAPLPVTEQFPRGTPGGFGLLLATLSLVLYGATWKVKSRPGRAVSFAALVMMTVGMSGCASLPKSPGGQATPPGNYPLVVTATAPNGSTSIVNLTLTVLP